MLVGGDRGDGAGTLLPEAGEEERSAAGATVLADLGEAISCLTPPAATAPISPQAGKTLALAHTQRGAVYHTTAKRLLASDEARLAALPGREEAGWTRMDFEEAASRDVWDLLRATALGGLPDQIAAVETTTTS